MFEYGVEMSYNEMNDAIKESLDDPFNKELIKAVEYKVGTHLHWLFDYFERVSNIIIIEDVNFFLGLKFANNNLKHNKLLKRIVDKKGGFRFPIRFPMTYESVKFVWDDIDPKVVHRKNKYQYEKYKEYIQGKNVLATFEEAQQRLEKYK